MKSTLTSKGQVTVPKRVRQALRLQEGTQLDWTLTEDGSVMVRPIPPEHNPFQAALGAFPLPEDRTVTDVLGEMRGERDPELGTGLGANVVTLGEFLKRQAGR